MSLKGSLYRFFSIGSCCKVRVGSVLATGGCFCHSALSYLSAHITYSRVLESIRLHTIECCRASELLMFDGPPEGFLTRFLNVFGEKIEATQMAVENAMAELGWLDAVTAGVG